MKNKLPFLLLCFLPGLPLFAQQTAETLLRQSILYFENGDYRISREAATDAFSNLGRKGKKSLRAELNFQLARVELEFGNFQKADSLLKLAAKKFKKMHPSHARALAFLAFSFLQQAKYVAADSMLAMAGSAQEKALGKNHPDFAETLDWLGLSKFEQRKPEEALAFYEEAKGIRAVNPGKRSLAYAISLDHLAEYYLEKEEAEPALAACEEAMKIVGEHSYRNRLLNTFGRICLLKDENHKAADAMDTSLQLQEKLGVATHPHFAKTLDNRSKAAKKLGDKKGAYSFLFRAKDNIEKSLGKLNPEYAVAANNLADVMYSLSLEGNTPAEDSLLAMAGELMDEAANLFQQFGQKDNYLIAKQNAALYLSGAKEKGKREKALAIYGEVVQSSEFDELLKDEAKAKIFKNYAEALWTFGDTSLYAKGDTLIRLAEQAYLRSFSPDFMDYLIFSSARAEISELRKDKSTSSDFHARNCRQLANMLQGNYPMMNEKQRLFFFNEYLSYYPGFAKSFAQRHPAEPELNRSLLELQAAAKGASLQINLDERLGETADTLLNQLSDQYRQVKRLLINMLLDPEKDSADKSLRLDSLNVISEDLERQMSRQSARIRELLGQAKNTVAYDSLRLALAENEALVDFLAVDYFDPVTQQWGKDSYCALVCRRDFDFPQFVPLAEMETVNGILYQSDPSQNASYVKSLPVNHDLFAKIWQPLEAHLKGAERVFLCPEGALHQLAFHALYTDSLGSLPLGKKYDLRYRLSPGDILRRETPQVNKSIALMGGARFDHLPPLPEEKEAVAMRGIVEDTARGGYLFPYLPGSKTEVLKISELFKKNKWQVELDTGLNGSEENFRKSCELGCPGVIHLATHGKYFTQKEVKRDTPHTLAERIYSKNEPMMRSLVALSGANVFWKSTDNTSTESDGILTALEISNLDLSGVGLVLLSACETGRGDVLAQEGVFGLQRAFRLAGARSVIVSLWRVPDRHTAELMVAFYRHWLGGASASDALRNAQADMAKNYDPYFWAAFVLVE